MVFVGTLLVLGGFGAAFGYDGVVGGVMIALGLGLLVVGSKDHLTFTDDTK